MFPLRCSSGHERAVPLFCCRTALEIPLPSYSGVVSQVVAGCFNESACFLGGEGQLFVDALANETIN